MSAIAEKLNVTKRTVERVIRRLREKNKLERIGGKRYGRWKIHEQTLSNLVGLDGVRTAAIQG